MLRQLYQIISVFLLFSILFNGARASSVSEITAQSWLIADDAGNIIDGINVNDVRSIASITKLMTAIVVIDSGASLTETLKKPLYNKKVNRYDLIYLAIVKSDNHAAKMLCDTYPYGYENCIKAMNEKAKYLEMYDTVFVDPTGRYHANISTAKDLIKLVIAASQYEIINAASNTDKIVWNVTKQTKLEFNNTNSLVGSGVKFIVSKTGWISASGGCIVLMLETINGIRTVILLGSKTIRTRIPEAYLLIKSY